MPSRRDILSIYADPGTVPHVISGLVCYILLINNDAFLLGTEGTNLDAQIGSPLLPEPSSPAQFALMNEWLRVCRQTHTHGQLTPRALSIRSGSSNDQDLKNHSTIHSDLPTRIIDVGDQQTDDIRLIDREAMTSHEYIALSHCWGQGPMISTRTDNINSHRLRIDIERLPRSFQDAVTVSRGLNIRYLWIDSLCIIQDDNQDWDHEAARMQQVFSNAVCVIAATSVASSAEGFLRPSRQQREWVTLRSPSGATRYICKSIDNFQRDVEAAILNKRGWVLQERALARRSIHFTSTQLYMECGRGVHCESLHRLVKYAPFSSTPGAFLND